MVCPRSLLGADGIVNSIISEILLETVSLSPALLPCRSIRSRNNVMDSHRHGTNVLLIARSHIRPVKVERGQIGVKHMLVPVW